MMKEVYSNKTEKLYYAYEDYDGTVTTWYVFENIDDIKPKYIIEGGTKFLSLFTILH